MTVLAIFVFYSEHVWHLSHMHAEQILSKQVQAHEVAPIILFRPFCCVRDADDLPSKLRQLASQYAAGSSFPLYASNTVVDNRFQCPPLGTIWVYTILQLDLVPAVLALAAVGFWVWWTGARLVFN
jgi:hypothetical protein